MHFIKSLVFNFRSFLLIFLAGTFLFFTSCGQPLESYLERGDEFLQKQEPLAAEMQFRAAIGIDEESPEAHWGLALSYEKQRKFLETVQQLQKVAELAPNNLEAKVKLGNYFLVFTPPQIRDAKKILQSVLKQDGNFIDGHILKASILSAQGKPENEVLAVLNHAISIDKKRAESYLALSRYYMRISKPEIAEQVIKTAISVSKNRSIGYIEHGRFLTFANRVDEAEIPFLTAIEVEPKNIEARGTLASHYLQRRQLKRAEQAYKDMVRIQENSAESRMDLANFYAFINQDDEAIKVYKEILREKLNYARARYKLAEIYLNRKDLGKVNIEVEKLLSVNNADAEALMLRVRAKLQESKAEDAVKDLQEILKKQPSLQTALFYMSQARLLLGQVDQAKAFIGDLQKYHPKYLRTGLLKIQAGFLANQPEIALREANALISRVSRVTASDAYNAQELEELRVRGITARGIANLQMGKTNEAERDLRDVVRMSPNSAGAKINLAKVYLAKADLPGTLELYEKALEIDKRNFDALSGVVSVLIRQKGFEKAKARINQQIKESSGDKKLLPAFHYLRSDVLVAEGDFDVAESELKKAIEIDEGYLPAYSAYASLLFSKNQTDAALAQYKKIVEKKPSASIYTLMGMIEDGKENYDAAEKHYRKALEIDPGAPIAANNLAWMVADQNRGNLDEALKIAQETADRNQSVAGYYDTLGWVNYKKGFYSRAVESFKKAVALDEAQARQEGRVSTPAYRLRLGVALASSGDKSSGRRQVAIALKNGEGDLSPKEIRYARSVFAGS